MESILNKEKPLGALYIYLTGMEFSSQKGKKMYVPNALVLFDHFHKV